MSVFNLFSKRQKALREEPSDILTYDVLPNELRVQIVHIVRDAIGTDNHRTETAYKSIHDILCREYGLFDLGTRTYYEDRIKQFFLDTDNVERVLDVIELSFQYVEIVIEPDSDYQYYVEVSLNAEDAIRELNDRFKEHAIGYQYESGEIIRVDSTYMHAEVVRPALSLLWNSKFNGANEEYRKAHEHHRHGRNKECLTDCLKAFESTMKIIIAEKGWAHNPNDTSRALVNTCISNSLIPSYLQTQFTSLRSLLESGIPTIRNRLGGHGQGAIQTHADDQTTRYALNLTGANIIYLIELSGIA